MDSHSRASQSLPLVHIAQPPREPGAEPYPVLILLHGRGADENDLLPLAESLDPRLFVVSARAPFARYGFHWYDLVDIGSPEPRTFGQGRQALETFVEMLPLVYPVDAGAVFLLGFSQGAMMSGTLALTRPDLVLGAVMLSGYLPLQGEVEIQRAALADKPFFVAHGTADQVIPIRYARETREYLVAAAARLEYHEYPIPHTIAPQELLETSAWLVEQIDQINRLPGASQK